MKLKVSAVCATIRTSRSGGMQMPCSASTARGSASARARSSGLSWHFRVKSTNGAIAPDSARVLKLLIIAGLLGTWVVRTRPRAAVTRRTRAAPRPDGVNCSKGDN